VVKTNLAQYRDESGIHLANFSDLVEIIAFILKAMPVSVNSSEATSVAVP
jgi:hypothetical protein